jgi:hypothetical protein
MKALEGCSHLVGLFDSSVRRGRLGFEVQINLQVTLLTIKAGGGSISDKERPPHEIPTECGTWWCTWRGLWRSYILGTSPLHTRRKFTLRCLFMGNRYGLPKDCLLDSTV